MEHLGYQPPDQVFFFFSKQFSSSTFQWFLWPIFIKKSNFFFTNHQAVNVFSTFNFVCPKSFKAFFHRWFVEGVVSGQWPTRFFNFSCWEFDFHPPKSHRVDDVFCFFVVFVLFCLFVVCLCSQHFVQEVFVHHLDEHIVTFWVICLGKRWNHPVCLTLCFHLGMDIHSLFCFAVLSSIHHWQFCVFFSSSGPSLSSVEKSNKRRKILQTWLLLYTRFKRFRKHGDPRGFPW